ncbi:MAG: transketolase [Rhodothermales bacterium]
MTDREEQAINTIRFLAVDAVQKANSGHPGMPMGCAPMAYVLWTEFLRHAPKSPTWLDRDRFVLSAGHGSMLLYALLHLTGYDLGIEDLKNFRQLDSRTPGHPENFLTPGVETTTGPLGQGFANGVGFAIAEKHLAAVFNRPGHDIIDHRTFGIVSDGDLMEGISHEAASLAGHLGLGKLIYLYDDNHISIEGDTKIAFTEDVDARFRAYGWHVQHVADGNDVATIRSAITNAIEERDKPSLISIRTIIGYGSPNKQNTEKVHGSPLGPDEVKLAKDNLGWPETPTFLVPDGVYDDMDAQSEGEARVREWESRLAAYAEAYPELAGQLESWFAGTLPADWESAVPTFEAGKGLASRESGGKVLDALAAAIPNLIGGSADLAGSNKTELKGRSSFQGDSPDGTIFHFGVREHAMAAITNGIVLHGGLIPFCASFLVFTDYLRPSLRLAALMGLPVVHVMTHDSIGLGEDGPTHQPVEHYMALRVIPNLNFIRPGDANETAEAWKVAIKSKDAPTVLALSRQRLATLDRTAMGAASGVARGGYVLKESSAEPEAIVIGTGSELQIAVEAGERLESEGISTRVVSLPCWRLFDQQPESYRKQVLPPQTSVRVAVEAGVTLGWERYVGTHGSVVGLDTFGASAPAEELYEHFGITADAVVARVKQALNVVSEG